MKDILRNFLEINDQSSGLMLLPLTTGSGKTHHVLEYIADLLLRNREQKVFFITTQKKNLPVDKLRRMYKGDDFDERVLRIQSVMDCIKENLTDNLVKEIKLEQQTLASSSKLNMLVAVRKEILRIGDENIETGRVAEREFRNELLYFLTKECKKDELLEKIKKDKAWHWVGKLYPMVYTSERQVYFMSMDKFMLPYNTLVDPAEKLIDSKWFKGAYVFIDEFDATKETILNRIIGDKNNKINLISLAKKITQGLNYTDFPTIYTGTPYNTNTIDNNLKNFNQLSEDYCLKYVFKTSNEIKSTDSFLFHDNGYWGLTTEKNLIVETDPKKKQNIINDKSEDNNNKTYTLYELLSKIQSKLTYFQNGVSYIAKDYISKKGVNLKTAVDSFLNLFLDNPYSDYISTQVMSILRAENDKKSEISKMDKFDTSFYKNGFRYTRLENDEFSNAEQSEVTLYSYNETPESVMEKMAKVAKIVGISATATLKTVLGNYDIDYLQRKLLDKYYVLSEREQKQLKDFLDKSRKDYHKTNINVKINKISEKEYADDAWLDIVPETDAQEITEALNNSYGTDNYKKYRFYKISWAFKQFYSHDDIKSFLCFMNLHPKKGNDLDSEILSLIFDRITGEKGGAKNFVEYLNNEGDGYDNNLKRITDRLSQGEKLFVISVYKTLGTGQNPQYIIPKDIEVEKINDLYEDNKKDFDAIYLDKPTHIISNLYDTSQLKWNDNDFLKFVFEMEYLCQNGDISETQKRELINIGSRKLCGIPCTRKKEMNFESMQPYKGLATQVINQGCGRICRTNKKNKNIYIFADKDISNVIDPLVRTAIPLSPEFEKLLYELEKSGIQPSAPTLYEDKAKKIETDTSRTISNYLSWEDKWTANKIDDWKQMRSYVLKLPAPNEQEFKTFPLYDRYIELPEEQSAYWYDQSEDYWKINAISFKKKLSQEVSEDDCQLKTLMKIPGIKEMFVRKGYATSWKPSKYLMSPSLYSRIYKGALGEVVGKQIFKDTIGVELVDIEDSSVYEFFDYQVPSKNIYVDFKKWKEINLGLEQSEKIRSEIFAKAKKCGAEKVLIVNIYSTTERQCKPPLQREECSLIEIPQLYVEDGKQVKLSIDSINVINKYLWK